MENRIFALDIGTRTVSGLLLEKTESEYKILKNYSLEHEERSMLDGQIHNVINVANIIKKIKENLESDGDQLTSVYVAAAGRALKTIRSKAEISLQQSVIQDEEFVKHLELIAVHEAQKTLVNEEKKIKAFDYHCVGYSVMHYYLDDEKIGSLIDQHGEKASVEVIATFLPKVVVESLIAALKRADLQMKALTLEPIAAIEVLVPNSMRRLNIALVDIGAGTSDIAITNDETVVAYGMVPIAGDEITEILSDTYLLDYKVAEEMKRTISKQKEVIVNDILGFEHKITYDSFLETIQPVTEKIAKSIADEILQLNKKAPKAVMLIGGGSLTPKISELLANKLNVMSNRVAIRDVEALQNIKVCGDFPTGPDFITPIGIAITAKEKPVDFLKVKINDIEIQMFEMKDLTISDALIQANIPLQKYYGPPGIAYTIKVNGTEQYIRANLGQAPIVFKNNERVGINTLVEHGDQITIEQGKQGENPTVSLQDYFGKLTPITVYINNEKHTIEREFVVNGERKEPTYIICDGDEIVTEKTITIEQLLKNEMKNNDFENEDITITVNNERIVFPTKTKKHILLNGVVAKTSDSLQDGDHIEIKQSQKPTIKDLILFLNYSITKSIHITFNGEPIQMNKDILKIYNQKTNEKLKMTDPLNNFDQLTIKEENHSFIFQDVFRYVDIDLSNIKGYFHITVNGEKASFHTPIASGDALQLTFDHT